MVETYWSEGGRPSDLQGGSLPRAFYSWPVGSIREAGSSPFLPPPSGRGGRRKLLKITGASKGWKRRYGEWQRDSDVSLDSEISWRKKELGGSPSPAKHLISF